MLKNPIIKNILAALAVTLISLVLIIITFIFNFVMQSAIGIPIEMLTQIDPWKSLKWFPLVMHMFFVIFLGLTSTLVFTSKLKETSKASFLTIPIAVALLTVGIVLHRWPIWSYSLSAAIFVGLIAYYIKTKKPWLYYYSTILITVALLALSLFGKDI